MVHENAREYEQEIAMTIYRSISDEYSIVSGLEWRWTPTV